MKRSAHTLVLFALIGMGSTAAFANGQASSSIEPKTERPSSMSQDSGMIDLFNRWEQVWNDGKFDLAPSCLADSYIRHDPKGDHTVSRDAYTAEVIKIHEDRPGIRVVVYDHSFIGDRAWFRFAFKWTDPKSGEAHTQAGIQVYRVAGGKLAETLD
jgi:SnoaL-like domain